MNYKTAAFNCIWEEKDNIVQPTVIYIPDLRGVVKESIKLSPEGKSAVIQTIENSDGGYLIIPVSGRSVQRTIEFNLRSDHTSITIERK